MGEKEEFWLCDINPAPEILSEQSESRSAFQPLVRVRFHIVLILV